MPLLPGIPLDHADLPSPKPDLTGSSAENNPATTSVGGPDLQGGRSSAGHKRAFNDTELMDIRSNAQVNKRPRNAHQLSGPSSITTGGGHFPIRGDPFPAPSEDVMSFLRAFPPLPGKTVKDHSTEQIPIAEPGRSQVAQHPSSKSVISLKERSERMNGRGNEALHADRRLANVYGVPGTSQAMTGPHAGAGFFSNANNIIVNQPTMIDQSHITHIVNNLTGDKTVLDILYQKMTKGADIDSSVRWPPPKCYPGTRVKLTTKIQAWFLCSIRDWDFLWLGGPAGVGKSAVAQTVAEYAAKEGILGAAYFFSRSNKRCKYIEVVITLAYQLATRFPGYQPLAAAKLAAEPDLLEKAPHIQFRKLIVEPLLLLSHERKHVIILDGLDECDGEDNQLEIIELINNILRSKISLPIIWMISSRPEPHLERVAARTDYIIQCWREYLPIESDESRNDTEIFVRGRFKEIRKRYGEYVEEGTDGSWPLERAIELIVEKTLGFFVFADTLLGHIEDSEAHEPDQRLGEVLAFLKRSHPIGSRNPIHNLDLFYTRILSNVPNDRWSIVRQILVASTFCSITGRRLAVQPMCNLLGITRARFYAALRQLHSVIRIPDPSDATETPLYFFHITFLDYLTDSNRAGRFFIGKLVASGDKLVVVTELQDFVLSGLLCLVSAVGLSRFNNKVRRNQQVTRSLEVALSWPSGDAHANWACADAAVALFSVYLFELICTLLEYSEPDDGLLNAFRSIDFKVFAFHHTYYLYSSLKNLDKLRPSSLVRNQSVSEWDEILILEVLKEYPHLRPLDLDTTDKSGFFLLGEGINSVAVVVTAEFGHIIPCAPRGVLSRVYEIPWDSAYL